MELLARQAPEHHPGLILKVKRSYELLIGYDLEQEKAGNSNLGAVQMKVYRETDLP